MSNIYPVFGFMPLSGVDVLFLLFFFWRISRVGVSVTQ